MNFQELKETQHRLQALSGEEFKKNLLQATATAFADWDIQQRLQAFRLNPVAFITLELDTVTGAAFLDLCMEINISEL